MLASKYRLLAILLLGPTSFSVADQQNLLPPQFTLSQYIPADFWFVANVAPNPKSQWIRDQWCRVADSIAESRIDSDLLSFIATLTDGDDDAQHNVGPLHMLKVIRNVPWRELLKGELAVAERMRRGSLDYEYVMLARSSPDTVRENMAALTKLFQSLSQTHDALRLSHTQQHGIDQWLLRDTNPGHFGMGNFKLTLLQKDDIVGLILGARARKEVLSLITGQPDARSILQAPRFQQALSQVDAPEDSYTFFNARMLIDDLSAGAMKLIAQGEKAESESPTASMVKAALKLVDIHDYVVTSTRTEGMQQHVQSVTRLQQGKKRAPLARMIYDRSPIERFDRYIPVDAVSFSVNSHVDVSRGYHLIRRFVAEHVPKGINLLSKFDATLDRAGFNIDRDFLSWFSGETISITLPAAPSSPMTQHDSVFFVRVKNPELAFQKINQALTFLTGKLREVGQPVFVRQIDTPKGQCCEVVHPLLAMIGRPVIGVTDNWLYFSNSMDCVNRCIAVSRGKAPSVLDNKRFLREGVIPPGPVQSISFTDRRHVGRELSRIVMAMNEVSVVIPSLLLKQHKNNQTCNVPKKLKHIKLVTHMLAAMKKLPAVLKEINFYSSEASYCTFDGQYSRSQGLITYRNPADEASDESSIVNIEILATP